MAIAPPTLIPGSLPTPRTRLIGREDERTVARGHLVAEAAPLLTMTGPGGVGKTRLALAIADEVGASFADGVVWVDLALLANAALVPSTIAVAAGVTTTPGRPPHQELARVLRSRQLLLALDNCERVLAETADLVGVLLTACPALQVLATSRAPLKLRGERILPVEPLPLPATEAVALVELAANPAIRLFVECARAVRPTFDVTEENAGTLVALCRHLDGLPLAIELAAARTTLLSPAALLDQMTDRLRLLRGGPRDLPIRHQALRATIAWSYNLLAPRARLLFCRLAVFAGGFTLDAALAVGTPDDTALEAGPAGGEDVGDGAVETLELLVDQSLVRVVGGAEPSGEPRLALLESIHAFAQERLVGEGDVDAARDRHAAYYLQLVEQMDAAVVAFLPDGHRVLDRLEVELPNLRLALDRFAERGNGAELLRLAAALDHFWQARGRVVEGAAWLERALTLGRDAPPRLRAASLLGLSGLLRTQGDAARALSIGLESLALARQGADRRGIALAAQRCSLLARQRGGFDAAAAFEAESLTAFDALAGEAWAARAASTTRGHVPLGRGDLTEAERQFREALARQRALGHEPGTSHPYACFPLIGLGDVARGRGDPAALARYQLGLRQAARFGEAPPIAYALGGVAGALAAAGRWQLAARLFGATEALCERSGLPFGPAAMDRQRALGLPEPWKRGTEGCGFDTPLRIALAGTTTTVLASVPDPEEAERCWAAGRALPAAAGIAEALAVEETAAAGPAAAQPEARSQPGIGDGGRTALVGGDLTRREREVLGLLCQRLTDPEIARALFLSPRTASKHVGNILAKLGVANRREVAALAVRHGLA